MKADCASQGDGLGGLFAGSWGGGSRGSGDYCLEGGDVEGGGGWTRLAGRSVGGVAHTEALSPPVSTLMTSACDLMSSPC